MKDKNKKLIIIVSCLIVIVVVSISFSYFTSKTTTTGEGQQTIVELATPNNTTLSVEGTIEFNDLDILPGHKNISGLKVTATGEEEVKFNIIWTGTNTINTPIKYYVYESTTKENPSITCEKKEEKIGAQKMLYEECTNNNFENIGNVISSGEITNNEEEIKYILKDQEVIEANPDGNTVYYYVVLEYPNLDEDQYLVDKDGKFKGKINAEVLSSSAINPVINNTTTSATSNSITVGVEATDNSGIGNYYYSINDGEYVKLSEGTYTFTNLNEYTNYKIKVYVDDIYGNKSEIKELTVRTEDASNPELTITTANEEPGDNDWYKSITLVASGEDTGSGVSNIKYCTTTSSSCTPTTIVEGATASVALSSNASEQKVCFQVADNSGKTSEITCSGTYKVDNTNPTATISSTSSTSNTITVNTSGSDSHSGIASYRYSINNGVYVQTTDSSHTFTGLNAYTTYTIKVQTVDKAGNVSSEAISNAETEIDLPLFYEKLLEDNPNKDTRVVSSFPFTTQNTGTLYMASGNLTEDGSTVYYFAGNALNNWVYFGGFYWRIIRTNEDGGIRLLYSGTSPSTSSGYISQSSFNNSYYDSMYVGYMYGTTGNLINNRENTINSQIKNIIDNWYSNNVINRGDNLENSYDTYVSKTAIYCNDRATDNNYAVNGRTFDYASLIRLSRNYPSYKCGNNASGNLLNDANNADKFSVSTESGGNGKLKYSVALITADEIAFAGGAYKQSSQAWYYYNSTGGSITGTINWWTMSPSGYHSGVLVGALYVSALNYPGSWNYIDVTGNFAIRPVLSLKSCVKWSGGDGSSSNPYQVTIDSACVNSEN